MAENEADGAPIALRRVSCTTVESRERILVVEDSAEIREALRQILEPAYEVATAENGVAGIAEVHRNPPSLVITDLVMPEAGGLEVCRALKGNPATAHVPVVILTGRGELKSRLAGFQSGADDYIQKPFNSRELLARVKCLLDNRALQRELARKNQDLERVLAKLKTAQQELLEAERLRTALKMASALAHEVNNPLAGIIGLCELLRSSLPPDSPQHRDVTLILRQAERIAEVMRNIRNLREVRFTQYVGEETMVDLSASAPPPSEACPPS